MKYQTIHVKRKHIDEGEPEDYEKCMVALAITEQIEGSEDFVTVDGDTARYYSGSDGFEVELPEFVRQHIKTFDSGCIREDGERDTSIIPEFSFELPVAVDE